MNKEIEQINVNLEEGTRVFDLAEEESRKELEKELGQEANFFRPLNDITYKIKLLDTKVSEIDKIFNGEHITKYLIKIYSVDKDKNEFTGIWEVGVGVLRKIFKLYEEKAVFAVTKTGAGQETRYNVVKDF